MPCANLYLRLCTIRLNYSLTLVVGSCRAVVLYNPLICLGVSMGYNSISLKFLCVFDRYALDAYVLS